MNKPTSETSWISCLETSWISCLATAATIFALIIIVTAVAALFLALEDVNREPVCAAFDIDSDKFELYPTGPSISGKSVSLVVDGEEQFGNPHVVIVALDGEFGCEVICNRQVLDERENVSLCIDGNLKYELSVYKDENITTFTNED